MFLEVWKRGLVGHVDGLVVFLFVISPDVNCHGMIHIINYLTNSILHPHLSPSSSFLHVP